MRGRKDTAKLIQRRVIDKNGVARMVWVKPFELDISGIISRFFSCKKDNWKKIPEREFKARGAGSGLDAKAWREHFLEYFRNKDRWDKFFQKKASDPKEHKEKAATKGRKKTTGGERKPSKYSMAAMRFLHNLYGSKKPVTEEIADGKDQSESGPETLSGPVGAVQRGRDKGNGAGIAGERGRQDERDNAGETGINAGDVGVRPAILVSATDGLTNTQKLRIRQQIKDLLASKPGNAEFTEAEKALLRQYEGAGGLGDDEASVREAMSGYYTPEPIIGKMWELAEKYVGAGARVLEPSAGIGRFLDQNNAGHKIDCVEYDETAARIAQILHPESKVMPGAFQQLFLDKSGRRAEGYKGEPYDLVIGNPPYGVYSGADAGRDPMKSAKMYEEYFLSRGLDTLKPGGTLCMIVPSGFMKKGSNRKFKEELAKKGRLMEAFRLPSNLFSNTGVGTDVLVIRKEPGDAADFSDVYFSKNPENVLGEQKQRTNRWGKVEDYIAGDITFLSKMDTGKTPPEPRGPMAEETKQKIAAAMEGNDNAEKPFSDAQVRKRNKEKIVISTIPQAAAKKSTYTLDSFIQQYGGKFDTRDVELWKGVDNAGFFNTTPDKKDFDRAAFIDGRWQIAPLYASGDIYAKLEALENDKDIIIERYGVEQYERQKAMLEKRKPVRKEIGDISISPLASIARDPKEFKVSDVAVRTYYGEESFPTLVDRFKDWIRNDVGEEERKGVSRQDIFGYVNKEIIRTPNGGNPKVTENRKSRRRDVAEELFSRFLREGMDPEEQAKFVDAYNVRYNSSAAPVYDQIPIFVEGLSTTFKGNDLEVKPIQLEGASFLCRKGSGILAYDVGVGKTMTGVLAIMQNMQRGWSKRPFICVPKPVYKKWIAEIHDLFPDVVINELGNMGANAGMDPAAIKDGTLSIATYESLENLTFEDETIEGLTADLADVMADPAGSAKKKNKKEEGEDAEKLDETAMLMAGVKGKGEVRKIEEYGFDSVLVDELHNFKNVFSGAKAETDDSGKKITQANEYANISGGASDRGAKMFLLTQYIQRENGGRNVFGLSATPFTNSPIEIYNILSFVARDRLKALGIYSVNQFMSVFVKLKDEWAVTTGGAIKRKTVVKEFHNLSSLQSLIAEYIDFRSGEEAGIKRPEKKVHTPELEYNEIQKIIAGVEEKRAATKDREHPENAIVAVSNMKSCGLFPTDMIKAIEADKGGFYAKELGPDGKADLLARLKKANPIEASPKMKFVCDSIIKMYKGDSTMGQIAFVPHGVKNFPAMVKYLVAHGVPKDAIGTLEGGGSGEKADDRKAEMTAKFNDKDHKLKIIIGTDTIKEGVDLNGNTGVAYDCELGWNPSDTLQKQGRLWRQGNLQKKVHIVYPLMADSVDSALYQKHDEKMSRFGEVWGRDYALRKLETIKAQYNADPTPDNARRLEEQQATVDRITKSTMEGGEIDPATLKFALIKDPVRRAHFMMDLEVERMAEAKMNLTIDIERIDRVKEESEGLAGEHKDYSDRLKEWSENMDEIAPKMAEAKKALAAAEKELKAVKADKKADSETIAAASRKQRDAEYEFRDKERDFEHYKSGVSKIKRDIARVERKQQQISDLKKNYDLTDDNMEEKRAGLRAQLTEIDKAESSIKTREGEYIDRAMEEIKAMRKVLPPPDKIVETYTDAIMADLEFDQEAWNKRQSVKAIINRLLTPEMYVGVVNGERITFIKAARRGGTFKMRLSQDGTLIKAKAKNVGETSTHADGSVWKKVGPDKWEEVREGRGAAKQEEPEERPAGKPEEAGGVVGGQINDNGVMRDPEVIEENGKVFVEIEAGIFEEVDMPGQVPPAGANAAAQPGQAKKSNPTVDKVRHAVKNGIKGIIEALSAAFSGKGGSEQATETVRTAGHDVEDISVTARDNAKARKEADERRKQQR